MKETAQEYTGAEQSGILLYHGSDHVVPVDEIRFPGPRDSCDFGRAFYTTANKHVAEEWVIRQSAPIINIYSFNTSEQHVFRLGKSDWIRVVIGFRTEAYNVEFKSSIIAGTIANDRMDVSFPAFLAGDIGDIRLFRCLDFCRLGLQYAFRNSAVGLTFVDSYRLQGAELARAVARYNNRRNDMEDNLRGIRRMPVPDEKYIEDYLKMGDYSE